MSANAGPALEALEALESVDGEPYARLRPSVAALAILPSGKMALLRPAPGRAGRQRGWELPRGPLLEGESAQSGVIRLLREQMGRDARGAALSLLGSLHQESALLDAELSVFCVFLDRDATSLKPDPEIREALGIFSWEQARELILASQIQDAVALSAFTLFHERHGNGKRPKAYELSATFFLRDLRGDYFNAWYPEALRLLNDLGLELELSADEPLAITAAGKAALNDDQIEQVALCLMDIGKHCVGRLWATQIVNGRESIDDLADPARALDS